MYYDEWNVQYVYYDEWNVQYMYYDEWNVQYVYVMNDDSMDVQCIYVL